MYLYLYFYKDAQIYFRRSFVQAVCLILFCREVIYLHTGLPTAQDNEMGDMFSRTHKHTHTETHTHSHTNTQSCVEKQSETSCHADSESSYFCDLSGLPSMETSCHTEELANWPASGDKHELCHFFIRWTHKHPLTCTHTKPITTHWDMLVNVKPEQTEA